jgi:hypothetical protein
LRHEAKAVTDAERVYSLARRQDDPTLLIWAYDALAATLYFLGDFEASGQNAIRGVRIWRSGNVQSHPEDVDTPVVACLWYVAFSKWHLGEIASSQATMAEAISLAKKLNDTNAMPWHSLGQRVSRRMSVILLKWTAWRRI